MDLHSSEFRDIVETLPLTEIDGDTFYRSVNVTILRTHKSAQFLDGLYSGENGHRYNSPNQAPTLYLAGSQTLASLEVEQDALLRGIRHASPEPRLVAAVRIRGARVFDLTNSMCTTALRLHTSQLSHPGAVRTALNAIAVSSYTQILGDMFRAYRTECDGLIAPSWLNANLHINFPEKKNFVLYQDPNESTAPRNAGVTLEIIDKSRIIEQIDAEGK